MRKKLINICILGILMCSIYGCAQTAEETLDAETDTVETDQTEIRDEETIDAEDTDPVPGTSEQEKQAIDSPVPQGEPEPEKEIDFDGSSIYLSILQEYERAWEDETYTVEQWQDVAGVFMTLMDIKFRLGTKDKDCTLYYSLSDLTGDGTDELLIGVLGEEGIAPCFLYYSDGERIHITDSRTGSELVNYPTILYENGIIESTEYIKYGMYRYNFYQRPEKPREQGGMELIDLYFYIEDPENGNQYYKGDMTNIITEGEFRSAINEYESLPQTELNWHELDGFWEPDKDGVKTTVAGEEYSRGEREEGSGSAAIEKAALKEEAESKKDEPITIETKVTYFHGDNPDRWSELEYDDAGNRMKCVSYWGIAGSLYGWKEYEYDSAGNQVKLIWYDVNGEMINWDEYRYDSAGNQVECIGYRLDGSVSIWDEYEYDDAGNRVKYISYWGIAGSHYGRDYGSLYGWDEYEYDSAGNRVKWISYYSDGCISDWGEYEYDSTGDLMNAVAHYANGGGYRRWHVYEYDSKGNKTRDSEYDAWGIRAMVEYEYDDAGNLTKMIEHGGENWYKTEHEYITITPLSEVAVNN